MLTELLREMGFEPGAGQPRVAVSACLLGQPVRYDGGHKYLAAVADTLAAWVTLVPLCPETAIGLPVPRPPIQVVRIDAEDRVRGVAAPEDDFSAALRAQVDAVPPSLDGAVLKARSPSCGLGTTPLHAPRGQEIGVTSGLFAARLAARFPTLPMCDETDLTDGNAIATFTLLAYCHNRYRQGLKVDALIQRCARLEPSLASPLIAYLQRVTTH